VLRGDRRSCWFLGGSIRKEVFEYARLHIREPVDGEAKMIKYVCVNGTQNWVVMEEEPSYTDFLRVIPQKWGECLKVELEVGTEEKGGAELYESKFSNYGDENEGRARTGEESSMQCPGRRNTTWEAR